MKIILESKKLRKELNKEREENERLRNRLYDIASYIDDFSEKYINKNFGYWDSVQLTTDIYDLCDIYEIGEGADEE